MTKKLIKKPVRVSKRFLNEKKDPKLIKEGILNIGSLRVNATKENLVDDKLLAANKLPYKEQNGLTASSLQSLRVAMALRALLSVGKSATIGSVGENIAAIILNGRNTNSSILGGDDSEFVDIVTGEGQDRAYYSVKIKNPKSTALQTASISVSSLSAAIETFGTIKDRTESPVGTKMLKVGVILIDTAPQDGFEGIYVHQKGPYEVYADDIPKIKIKIGEDEYAYYILRPRKPEARKDLLKQLEQGLVNVNIDGVNELKFAAPSTIELTLIEAPSTDTDGDLAIDPGVQMNKRQMWAAARKAKQAKKAAERAYREKLKAVLDRVSKVVAELVGAENLEKLGGGGGTQPRWHSMLDGTDTSLLRLFYGNNENFITYKIPVASAAAINASIDAISDNWGELTDDQRRGLKSMTDNEGNFNPMAKFTSLVTSATPVSEIIKKFPFFGGGIGAVSGRSRRFVDSASRFLANNPDDDARRQLVYSMSSLYKRMSALLSNMDKNTPPEELKRITSEINAVDEMIEDEIKKFASLTNSNQNNESGENSSVNEDIKKEYKKLRETVESFKNYLEYSLLKEDRKLKSGCIPARRRIASGGKAGSYADPRTGGKQAYAALKKAKPPGSKGGWTKKKCICCHKCPNDRSAPNGFVCTNPSHLYWGTKADNTYDQNRGNGWAARNKNKAEGDARGEKAFARELMVSEEKLRIMINNILLEDDGSVIE